jgi:hypothetical protein
MRLVVAKFSNGGWHGEIITMTDLPRDARRAIRFERGQDVVPMEAAFDVNGGIPIEVAPSPTPSSFTEPPVIPTSPEPQPSESPTPTIEPSPQPSEPSPQPSETFVQPSETPSPIPTPSDVVPSEFPLPLVEPELIQDPILEPEISFPESLIPIPDESPFPDLDLPSIDIPYDNSITDGLTAEEQAALNELLTEYGPMDAISFEDFEESSLDYEDLPDNQPVTLENGVVLFAEVADALEMFENPSEILAAVFTDPGKALTALANVGADMTPEKREESQKVVIASIIAAQILSTSNIIGRIR